MSEKQKNDNRQVDWSFDFGQLNSSLKSMFDSLAGDEELQQLHFSAPLGTAQSAKLVLQVAIGRGMLHAIHDEHLIVADLETIGDVQFELEEATPEKPHAFVKLSHKSKSGWNIGAPIKQGFRAIANRQELNWNIGISAKTALDLTLENGVGAVQADLSSLKLNKLSIDGGVGTLKLTLPPQEQHYSASVDCGVGAMSIFIPQGAHVTLDIDGGVGATEIVLPKSAAVRVKAEAGLGSIKVPDYFQRIKGSGHFIGTEGVWQTENYDTAEVRVLITYDGGIGGLSIHNHPEV